QHEHLVEWTLIRVRRPASKLLEALELGAEHVVEHEQMVIAGALGGLRVLSNHRGVRADLRLGKHHAEPHDRPPLDRKLASHGGAPAPRRAAARTALVSSPRTAGPQPRDVLRLALHL